MEWGAVGIDEETGGTISGEEEGGGPKKVDGFTKLADRLVSVLCSGVSRRGIRGLVVERGGDGVRIVPVGGVTAPCGREGGIVADGW